MHSKIDEPNTQPRKISLNSADDDTSSSSNGSDYPTITQRPNENLSLKVRIPNNNFVHIPKKRVLMFPARLYQMLQAVEQEGLDHIVAWRPHGKCFGVINASEFVTRILPRYVLWFHFVFLIV
jgi:HSF-type DNA-binding